MAAIIEVPNHYTPGRGTSPAPHQVGRPVALPDGRIGAGPGRQGASLPIRRLALLALAVPVLLLALAMLRPQTGAPGAGSLATGAAVEHVVVGPGDTLWSMAAELDPSSPRHEVVAQLVEINGGDLDVELGDVLAVPVLGG